MKTEKRNYKQPSIVEIKFDRDISLQLESNPPTGPDESYNINENFSTLSSPYKPEIA